MKSYLKPPRFRRFAAATLLAAASAGSANAVVIASYFDGASTTGANLADPVAGITVTSLTGVGVPVSTVTSITRNISGNIQSISTPAGPTAGSAVGSQWLNAPNNTVNNPTSPTTPISTDDFYSFTVTATSGTLPALASLKFDIATASVQSNGGLTVTYQLFAAADGGSFVAVGSPGTAADDGSVNLNPGGSQTTSTSGVLTADIDLTGLAAAQSYEFRIALYDGTSNAGTKSIWMQGIQLSIPEPSTALLGGLGCLLLFRRRRA